ncbi:hypothetical protein pb186bvf_019180 [Paramecium bursaria]
MIYFFILAPLVNSQTVTPCAKYLGKDGNCKGTSTNASCSARLCSDAPLTTDSACSSYQNRCVTNGFGCVSTLGACQSYTGTNTNCTQYRFYSEQIDECISDSNLGSHSLRDIEQILFSKVQNQYMKNFMLIQEIIL